MVSNINLVDKWLTHKVLDKQNKKVWEPLTSYDLLFLLTIKTCLPTLLLHVKYQLNIINK